MAFHGNYRDAQGQQWRGSPGGGYLFDQFVGAEVSKASTVLPLTKGIGVIPQFDTADFGVSILGDYEPVSVTPAVKVGRISLLLSTSLATIASNPIFSVKRSRTGVAAATLATFDLTTQQFAEAWVPVHRTGSQISNGTLLAGDGLYISIVSGTSGPPPIPGWIVQIDGEG